MEDEELETDVLEAETPFETEQVITVFSQYIKMNHADAFAATALLTHQPAISGNDVTVEVDNMLQKEKLEILKPNLVNYMRRNLNNGFITLTVQIYDESSGNEERKLITLQDKFNYLVEKNPVVDEMRKILGLELE